MVAPPVHERSARAPRTTHHRRHRACGRRGRDGVGRRPSEGALPRRLQPLPGSVAEGSSRGRQAAVQARALRRQVLSVGARRPEGGHHARDAPARRRIDADAPAARAKRTRRLRREARRRPGRDGRDRRHAAPLDVDRAREGSLRLVSQRCRPGEHVGAEDAAERSADRRPGGRDKLTRHVASVELTVVGSINVDLVARVAALPRPGETLSALSFERFPGGKGANQAVAAARLGAQVRMVGAVGEDAFADEALVGLRDAGVDLDVSRTGDTGVALIFVAADGENQIVVVPGANAALQPATPGGGVLCQLEVSDAVVAAAAAGADFFALNAAPVRPIDIEPDLLIVNRLEYEVVSRGRLVAVTYGADGAALFEGGREVARAAAPRVAAVDGTAAGDAFAACLTVSLLEGRPREEALRRACA